MGSGEVVAGTKREEGELEKDDRELFEEAGDSECEVVGVEKGWVGLKSFGEQGEEVGEGLGTKKKGDDAKVRKRARDGSSRRPNLRAAKPPAARLYPSGDPAALNAALS